MAHEKQELIDKLHEAMEMCKASGDKANHSMLACHIGAIYGKQEFILCEVVAKCTRDVLLPNLEQVRDALN